MALSLSGISLISTRVVAVEIAVGIVLGMFCCCMLFIFCNKKSTRRRIQTPTKVLPAGGEPRQWQQNIQPPSHIVTMPPTKPTPAPQLPYLPIHSASLQPPSLFLTSSGGTPWSNPLPPPSFWMPLGPLHIELTYEELVMATGGFSESNFLGQGGFAEVYKGVLPKGKMVAVKKLKTGSGQGEHEFQSELEIIRRIHHRHLVSLVGYCVADAQRFIVYEFIPNKTLEFHLHGRNRPVMEFPTRLRIALGAAKAIAYLHEDCDPKIIHHDIKSANILIDCNFEAKVADFGLAKFTSDAATHVSTRVMGTFGYLAPEFTATGRLTFQCDVFSYGVVLLELITGRRPVDAARTSMDDTLVKWARPLLTRAMDDGSFDSIADPRLQKQYNHSEMARMLSCAEACIRLSARRRPRMSQVVRALEAEFSLSDLNEGTRPGHSSEYGSQRISEDELIKLSLLAEFPNIDRYNV